MAKDGVPPGHMRAEKDLPATNQTIPRNREAVAKTVSERGVPGAIVRLPRVHDQGLVPFLTQTAREKRVSAYVGYGANRWAGAACECRASLSARHREDGPGFYYGARRAARGCPASGDRGGGIGRGLKVPVISLTPAQAAEHFG